MGTLVPSNLSSVEGTLVPPEAEDKLLLHPPLALLIFIIIPCVILLFCLNCFLLIHRLPVFSANAKAKRRGVPKPKHPRYRVNQNGHYRLAPRHVAPSSMSLGDRHRVSDTISKGLEATMAVVGGCPESIDEPQTLNGCHKRFSQCTSCSRPAACIMPTSTPCCSCSRRLWTSNCSIKPQEKLMCTSHQVEDDMGREWFQYARSFCENDTRHDAVPPNSPEAATVQAVTPKVKFSHTTSTQKKTQRGLEPFTPLSSINFERTGILHQDDSAQLSYCSGLQGPGLDSDFGVSAGVSLHILSTDSDNSSLSWISGMEWDYYDPYYMRRTRHRRDTRQNHHLPVLCSKQYWV
ncbi:protein huluwa-like [Pelobates fuscus]|uniref:protein huluwa-like n=1 Tax=Pelobates fuscus TaxID=191477 RepID=UPI002FE4C40A